jgi:hypothetical protein
MAPPLFEGDATGKWLETETTIALPEVPRTIRDKFTS